MMLLTYGYLVSLEYRYGRLPFLLGLLCPGRNSSDLVILRLGVSCRASHKWYVSRVASTRDLPSHGPGSDNGRRNVRRPIHVSLSEQSLTRPLSTTVQGRHEDDVIAVLKLVLVLALELPIGIVDQHEYTRSSLRRVSTQTKKSNSGFALTLSRPEQRGLSSDVAP